MVKVSAVTAGTCPSKSTIEKTITIPTTNAHPAVNMRRMVGEKKTILVIDAERAGKQRASGRRYVGSYVCCMQISISDPKVGAKSDKGKKNEFQQCLAVQRGS